MDTSPSRYGYCHITFTPQDGHVMLRSNSERAFIITQLQDLLSPRFILGTVPAYRQLASCIDLLAFSIAREAIHLIVFTIDPTLASDFAHRVAVRLAQYQYEYGFKKTSGEVRIAVKNLAGPHEALAHTVAIHLSHQDWEHDRYSSIGFYLHDRRGDWMRIWKLTNLYDNEPTVYREIIEATLGRPDQVQPPTMQFLAHPAS